MLPESSSISTALEDLFHVLGLDAQDRENISDALGKTVYFKFLNKILDACPPETVASLEETVLQDPQQLLVLAKGHIKIAPEELLRSVIMEVTSDFVGKLEAGD